MVLAPGGENPQREYLPSQRSVGIRLTKRNVAIKQIQELRQEMLSLENPESIGHRKLSTATNSAFGARHYQPHIKLLRPGNEVDRDLNMLGVAFRKHFSILEFGKYSILTKPPKQRK